MPKKIDTIQGLTLVEMMVSVAILVIIFGFFFGTLRDTGQYANNIKNDLEIRRKIDKGIIAIRDDLLRCRSIFERGTSFRATLGLSAPALVNANNSSATVLPDIGGPDNQELLGIDGTSETVGAETFVYSNKTGNFLMFAKKRGNALCDIDDDDKSDYDVDIFSIVAYYPTIVTGDNNFGTGYSTHLVRWESVIFADYTQIQPEKMTILEERKKVLDLLLNHTQIRIGVDFGQQASLAFYQIDVVDNTAVPLVSTGSFTPLPSYVVEQDSSTDPMGLTSTYSLGLCEFNSNPRAYKYATPAQRFPGGFEAQINVFNDYTLILRLVLMKTIRPSGQTITRSGETIIRSSKFTR